MADNFQARDGNTGALITIRATDLGAGVYAVAHRVIDASGNFMPVGDAVARKLFFALTDGTDTAGIDDVDGVLDERSDVYLQTIATLFAQDAAAGAGSQNVPLKVESTAQPNLRVAVMNGANQMPAGDTAARAVHTAPPIDLVDVTLSLDTSAYANGDLLAETQEVAGAVRISGGKGILVSVLVVDEDDQKAAFDIYILGATGSFGAENAAPSPTDAVLRDVQAVIPVATGDYKDLGSGAVANIKNIGAVVEAAGGSTSLWVAVVNGSGTPTYTASGVRLRLGFQQG